MEVSLDGGKSWQQAVLKPPISKDTWALWAFEWKPSQTGAVNVYPCATDGTGAVQSSGSTGSFPNGEAGYALTTIDVTK